MESGKKPIALICELYAELPLAELKKLIEDVSGLGAEGLNKLTA